MINNDNFPTKLLILVSLIQGLMLLFLHQSIELKFWPYQSPPWLFSFYSMAFVGPTLLLLGLRSRVEIAVLKWVAPFTLLCGLLGYYIGYQSTPIPHVRYDTLLFAFITTMAIAVFKALMYIQQFVSGEKFSYNHLFRWSWRNFLTLTLSLLFALCVWGVLMLWAGLFKAIKIDFFHDLFTESWFYYPAIALANGFGVIIFRNQSVVIDTITRLQQALMKFLLILIVLVSIIFLVTLPFSGLAPLWETGGSGLILWMQAIILFFINAVYQDDPEHRPYHLWLHRFIYCGAVLLPIYSAISFYGLTLRVDQYGWTVARCWAMVIWLLLASFSFGYLYGILRKRDNWLQQLSKINVTMGLAVLVIMLLVNSPFLDFRKISVHSQMGKLASNEITLDDLDLNYFRYHLARPGYLALQDIKTTYAQSNPEFILRINALYADREAKTSPSTKEEFFSVVNVLSGTIPDEVGTFIYEDLSKNAWNFQYVKRYHVRPIDVNEDDQLEYLLIQENESYHSIFLYYFEAEKWHTTELRQFGEYKEFDQTFLDAVKANQIDTQKSKWQDLKIGDHLLRVE